MYHISLYFDENGTDKINKLIRSVEKKTGCTYMSDNNIVPHLTLAVSRAAEHSGVFYTAGKHAAAAGAAAEHTSEAIPAAGFYCAEGRRGNVKSAAGRLDNIIRLDDIIRLADLRINAISEFELKICSIGCFKPHVLYIQPVLCAELDRLAALANGIFDEACGIREENAYMQYSRIEHISIAKGLNEEQMRAAFAAAYSNFKPFKVKAAGLKLENTNPRAVIKKWEFL